MNYKQIYDNIINYRLDNPFNGYTEKHHILPRSLGGCDNKSNLVNLSALEHYICHLLLTKIYPKGGQEYYKMIKAYNLMAKANSPYQQRDYKINVNLYENLRVELSKSLSISQTGKGNSQYGTFWIYNPNTKISKKVPYGYMIDGDWEIGYVTNWDKHFSQRHCVECGKKGVLQKVDSKTCSIECKKSLMSKSIKLSTKRNKIIFYNDIELIFDNNFKIDLDQIENFVVKYTETKSIPKSIEYIGRGVSKANYKLARYLIEEIKI